MVCFDTEYQYKTEEARKAGGKLLWDMNNTDATGEDLFETNGLSPCKRRPCVRWD